MVELSTRTSIYPVGGFDTPNPGPREKEASSVPARMPDPGLAVFVSMSWLRQHIHSHQLHATLTMVDYDFRPGGSLKFKGGVADGGIVKKCVHN